jgi:hypothetical protein
VRRFVQCAPLRLHSYFHPAITERSRIQTPPQAAPAGKLNALITLNLRGKRSKTDSADNDPNMTDALELAKALDVEFALTGKLKGPLHGIPFAICTRSSAPSSGSRSVSTG